MSTKRSVLKYMEYFANNAIEGLGIKDILTGKNIVDNKKFSSNYMRYNAMMAGYFYSGKEYSDEILYKKYLFDIAKSEVTPEDFTGLLNSIRLEEFTQALSARSEKENFYKKVLIAFEMGKVSRSIINELDNKERREFETIIYDTAYRYDEIFSNRRLNNEETSKFEQSKVKILKKATI